MKSDRRLVFACTLLSLAMTAPLRGETRSVSIDGVTEPGGPRHGSIVDSSLGSNTVALAGGGDAQRPVLQSTFRQQWFSYAAAGKRGSFASASSSISRTGPVEITTAFGSSSAAAQAIFTDEMVINSPGLAGRTGQVTFGFDVSFAFFDLDPTEGNATINAGSGGSLSVGGQAIEYDLYPDSTTRNVGTATFTFGTPFAINVDTSASSYVSVERYNTGLGGRASFGIYLGDFADVKVLDSSSTATPVASFSMTAQSGANYAAPVASPAPIAIVPGDADLNGIVNFDDLLVLARNYNKTVTLYYGAGDFNADGKVDFDDLLALARSYGRPVGGSTQTLSEAFQADWTLAQSVVPEPTVTGLLGALTMAGSRRRRV